MLRVGCAAVVAGVALTLLSWGLGGEVLLTSSCSLEVYERCDGLLADLSVELDANPEDPVVLMAPVMIEDAVGIYLSVLQDIGCRTVNEWQFEKIGIPESTVEEYFELYQDTIHVLVDLWNEGVSPLLYNEMDDEDRIAVSIDILLSGLLTECSAYGHLLADSPGSGAARRAGAELEKSVKSGLKQIVNAIVASVGRVRIRLPRITIPFPRWLGGPRTIGGNLVVLWDITKVFDLVLEKLNEVLNFLGGGAKMPR